MRIAWHPTGEERRLVGLLSGWSPSVSNIPSINGPSQMTYTKPFPSLWCLLPLPILNHGIMTTLSLSTPKVLMYWRCFLIYTNSLPTASSPSSPIASSSTSEREIQRTTSSAKLSSSSSSQTGHRTGQLNCGTTEMQGAFPSAGRNRVESFRANGTLLHPSLRVLASSSESPKRITKKQQQVRAARQIFTIYSSSFGVSL